MKPDMRNIDDVVNRYLPSASKEDVESGGARVLQRLESNPAVVNSDLAVSPGTWWKLTPMRAAVAASLVIATLVSVWTLVIPEKAYAIVHSVTGSLLRVDGGKTQSVRPGERIELGTPLRTESGAGAVLRLPDGASIEMHEKSDVQLEPTKDGMSIRLNDGSVHVTPAKQPAGNLYVQTKDGTVPVVAALFQSVTEPRAGQNREPREAFEVASIRMRTGGGGGGGPRGAPGQASGGADPCSGSSAQIDPRRYALTNVGLYNLITRAYGLGSAPGFPEMKCATSREMKFLTGGADWAESVTFDIEATIPEGGPPVFTTRPESGPREIVMAKDESPRLQSMLRTLLAERFKLVVRRDVKEVPGYVLSAPNGAAKLRPWKEGDMLGQYLGVGGYDAIKNGINSKPQHSGLVVGAISAGRSSMADLAYQLGRMTGKPVVDRTNVPGHFVYEFFFAPADFRLERRRAGETRSELSSPSLFKVLEDELGLKLEPSQEKIEVLVIESVEKPSEN
jgi:uncharacterized protein (TIGR03435 family)